MSCSPSYNYTPIFGGSANDSPSSSDCTAPSSTSNRSRLFAGGTYFRSIAQGPNENDIELELTFSLGQFFLKVYAPVGSPPVQTHVETFGPVTNGGVSGSPPNCTNGSPVLRGLVGYDSGQGCGGGSSNNSSYIEMVPRGCDTGFDAGGSDGGNCLSAFGKTAMSGGGPVIPASYIPTSEFQDPIRTGPQRTMYIISSEEDYFGEEVDPAPNRKVIQWDGTEWIYYSNLVQGSCPADGPVVDFL